MAVVEGNDGTSAAEQASRTLVRSAGEMSTLRQAVASDSLRLDPAAGEEIRSMLDEHMSQVDMWLQRAGNLALHAPLGQNPVGAAMAVKFANRADGDENSFTGVLKRYREILREAHDVVGDAMRTYRELDNNAADSFRKLVD
jgi:hypothetical protein